MKSMIGEWAEYDTPEIEARIKELEISILHAKLELARRAKLKRGNYKRDERKAQIMRVLEDGKIRSTAEIAAAIDMSASGHLRNMLCELYESGKILGYAEKTVGRHLCYWWYLQSTLPLPFPPSSVEPICASITEAVGFPF